MESNPFVVSWWPRALADPALFHVSLQTASLDEELRAQKGFPISELLMSDSVSLLPWPQSSMAKGMWRSAECILAASNEWLPLEAGSRRYITQVHSQPEWYPGYLCLLPELLSLEFRMISAQELGSLQHRNGSWQRPVEIPSQEAHMTSMSSLLYTTS
ncbi:hypothetical protein NKR23_g5976 [Pleurostoma richardsiae]|uniref:Uncharacterized protein n=1 Tax=Pleurostoma richardsiae TaxID=41990 RepID=A0AA38RRG5_9PEZI|nr:hypothetical protein NKR23_g5976 [Pleurostoma richardsiae]